MTTYVDSSALVALYVPERFSDAARKAVQSSSQVPFTRLHELEVSNAFALLAGRGAITSTEHDAVRGQLREDVEGQRLLPTQVEWDDVFTKAGEFSATHTTKLFTRSLDLLHIAAAHLLEMRSFVSADDRQLAVAKATGLRTIDIKVHRRGRSKP
jgi:predicted nucleic acid-binding protein